MRPCGTLSRATALVLLPSLVWAQARPVVPVGSPVESAPLPLPLETVGAAATAGALTFPALAPLSSAPELAGLLAPSLAPAASVLESAGRRRSAVSKSGRGLSRAAKASGRARRGEPVEAASQRLGSYFDRAASYAAVDAPEEHGLRPPRRKPAPEPVEPPYEHHKVGFNGAVFPSVAFRPDVPVSPLLVRAIDASKKSIRIAIYEFKLREILPALWRARERGVKVELVVDHGRMFPEPWEDSDYVPHRSQELQWLLNAGFDVTVLRGGGPYGIQHNKFAVFDEKLVVFGSYNWSFAAEDHHFENAVFSLDRARVRGHLEYFDYLRQLSLPFDKARRWPHDRKLPPAPAAARHTVVLNGARLPAYFFSPGGGGEDWIVKAIRASKKSVDVSMFTLKSTKIAEALADARARKLRVRVILDESQAAEPQFRLYARWLAYHGVEVRTLAGPDPEGPEWFQKNHNKLAIFDGKVVETGSFNYTKNADRKSFENGHFLEDPVDVGAFAWYYARLYRKAEPLGPPGRAPRLPTDEELSEELSGPPPPTRAPPALDPVPPARTVRYGTLSLPSSAFRPGQDVSKLIVDMIGASKKTVRVALYQFRVPGMLEALQKAKRRGVRVDVIADFKHVFPTGKDPFGQPRRPSPEIEKLLKAGFELRVLRGRTSTGSQHNKIILVDDALLQYGSYNYTDASERSHYENVRFEERRKWVKGYRAYWDYMWKLAATLEEAPKVKWPKRITEPPPSDPKPSIRFRGKLFPAYVFSPSLETEGTIIRAIRAAKTSIDVAMFSFYSVNVAEALKSAKRRGVKVRIVIDESQSKIMKLDNWFAYYGFDVKILSGPDPHGDAIVEKHHNKFIVLDGRLLITGSFNYTPNALANNFENMSLVADAADLRAYGVYFGNLYRLGWKPLKPKKVPDILPAKQRARGAQVAVRPARRVPAR